MCLQITDDVNNGKLLLRSAWDHDGIDHWKIEPLTLDDVHGNTLVEETSFSTLFPKYREQYVHLASFFLASLVSQPRLLWVHRQFTLPLPPLSTLQYRFVVN